MDKPKPYACPTSEAEYKVVRVAVETGAPEGRLTCRKCGGPLHAREGRYILKYFLVGGSRRYLRPRRSRTRAQRQERLKVEAGPETDLC
jgi:hypothetical protein